MPEITDLMETGQDSTLPGAPGALAAKALDFLRKTAKIIKNFSLLGKLSLAVIIFFIVLAVFAPYVSAYPYNLPSGKSLAPPGGGHPLGTDDLGIDIWAQLCRGAKISLIVGLGTALLAGLGGGLLGIISGYVGGILDKFLMRLIDIMLVIPDFPVMILLAAFLGPSLINIIIVLALFSWVSSARIARSQILMLKEKTYIKSAELYGAGAWYLMWKHFLPEIFPLIAVQMIRLTGRAIISEAGLSFLGLGDPTSKSWGLIIHYATSFKGIYFTEFWKWWLLYPWLFLTAMVTSLAFISRELEQVADPRVKR
jgi:peptide/nickel transport system permease protein